MKVLVLTARNGSCMHGCLICTFPVMIVRMSANGGRNGKRNGKVVTEMADVENVIKAWNCCNPFNRKCNECPYEKDCYHDGISRHMVADAISVIEEQQAEIERLTKTEEQKQAERKQKRREWQAKYRESHRKQAYQTTKEWRKNNPEKWKEQQKRYRERQKQLGR